MRRPATPTASAQFIAADDALLERIGKQRRLAMQAEAAELKAVVAWAEAHTLESVVDRSYVGPRGTEGVLFLAGTGARGVEEFAVCRLATTLAMSEHRARRYLGLALELRDRLPRLYANTLDGVLPVWRAKQVAEQTIALSAETAAYVDAHLAEFAHKISAARVKRCVEAAILRCQPDEHRCRAEAAAEARTVRVDDHLDGVSTVMAILATPDAAALEDTVALVADWLAVLGDTDTLDVRRAKALGLLADPQAVLAFQERVTDHVHASADPLAEPASCVSRPPLAVPGAGWFGIVPFHLHLHTTAEAVLDPVARVDAPGRHHPVPIAAVEQWLRDIAPGVVIRVTPVVDLTEQISVDQYEVPTRLARQIDERDTCCVFPWCGRRGRYDLDHIEEYVDPDEGGPPGQTTILNLARLCRFHHRVKTHSACDDTREPDGSLTWRSPIGQRFRVDHTGTVRLS